MRTSSEMRDLFVSDPFRVISKTQFNRLLLSHSPPFGVSCGSSFPFHRAHMQARAHTVHFAVASMRTNVTRDEHEQIRKKERRKRPARKEEVKKKRARPSMYLLNLRPADVVSSSGLAGESFLRLSDQMSSTKSQTAKRARRPPRRETSFARQIWLGLGSKATAKHSRERTSMARTTFIFSNVKFAAATDRT